MQKESNCFAFINIISQQLLRFLRMRANGKLKRRSIQAYCNTDLIVPLNQYVITSDIYNPFAVHRERCRAFEVLAVYPGSQLASYFPKACRNYLIM